MKRLPILLLLTGCATYQPLIDAQGVDMNAYATDLQQCRQYAATVNTGAESANGTVIGATIGAALGGIVGAFAGEPGKGAAYGAAYGGANGMLAGAADAESGKQSIVQRCLAGRGYSVLR